MQNVYYYTIRLKTSKKQEKEAVMSVQLLDKTRKINKLLHNSSSSKVVFNDICQVLMDRKDVEVMTCCCKGNEDENVKHKQRDEQEKKALMTRLSRIEGQVRGIRAMVEDDRYCVDILTQVSAIQAALNGFNKELLARHIKTCVSEDIREGNEEAVDELCELLKKLMK